MKRILLAAVFVSLIILPLKGEIALNLGMDYSGAFSIQDSNFSTNSSADSSIVSFKGTNASVFSGGKGGVGFNGGISFFFNYKMGFGISVASLKTKFNIANSFNWHFEWWNGVVADIDPKEWNSNGEVSAMTVNLNLIYRLVAKEMMKLNLFLGPTIYFVSPRLTGNGGIAGGPYEYNNVYYIDWYDVPLEITGSKTLFGGNGGLELEYFINESMALYFNGAYYFGGDINDNWKVKTGKYTGEFGNLVGTISNEDVLPDYKVNIKVSTFAVGFGVKVYL